VRLASSDETQGRYNDTWGVIVGCHFAFRYKETNWMFRPAANLQPRPSSNANSPPSPTPRHRLWTLRPAAVRSVAERKERTTRTQPEWPTMASTKTGNTRTSCGAAPAVWPAANGVEIGHLKCASDRGDFVKITCCSSFKPNLHFDCGKHLALIESDFVFDLMRGTDA
jgi:hypothetical protein